MQPVLWAVMVSLAAVWRSFGVESRPRWWGTRRVVAAACVAGGPCPCPTAPVWSSSAAARSPTPLAGGGGMVALPMAVAEVEELIAQRPAGFGGRDQRPGLRGGRRGSRTPWTGCWPTARTTGSRHAGIAGGLRLVLRPVQRIEDPPADGPGPGQPPLVDGCRSTRR